MINSPLIYLMTVLIVKGGKDMPFRRYLNKKNNDIQNMNLKSSIAWQSEALRIILLLSLVYLPSLLLPCGISLSGSVPPCVVPWI